MRIIIAALVLMSGLLACAQQPLPTHTPYPTPEPLPTHTPYPTLQALPTHTPYPTLQALPTHIPLPTHTPYPTPETPTETEGGKWTRQPAFNPGFQYSVLNTDEVRPGDGPWMLSFGCNDLGEPGLFLRNTTGNMFADVEEGQQILLVDIDGEEQEQNWWYFPPTDVYGDYFSYWRVDAMTKRLLEAIRLTVTIGTNLGDYVFSFDVAGLDSHISGAEEVCLAEP